MSNTHATLLVIDDDSVVRASIAAYLEDSGYTVLQAIDGVEGLAVFEKEQPDLVICDLRMPKLGGIELIRKIVEISSQIPVIVVSGAGVMNDAVEALRLGAADYLIKPIEDLAVLEHSIERSLERVKLAKENLQYQLQLQESLNLLQEDQDAGHRAQMNMLPETPWDTGGLHFSHKIIPSLYLSGDFIDYFRIDDDKVFFYLADVSGHGASSAFATILLKFITSRWLYKLHRKGIANELKPSILLSHINKGLINSKIGKHVTMVLGIIDEATNTLTYTIGGHLPLPVLCSEGKGSYLEGSGKVVGLFEDAIFEDIKIVLPMNYTLTLLSDGVLELLPGNDLKEKELLLPNLIAAHNDSLESLLKALKLTDLETSPDDISLLFIRGSAL